MESFPTAHIYQACRYADEALFFGEDVVLLKSPISGLMFIRIMERPEPLSTAFQFQPLKVISF